MTEIMGMLESQMNTMAGAFTDMGNISGPDFFGNNGRSMTETLGISDFGLNDTMLNMTDFFDQFTQGFQNMTDIFERYKQCINLTTNNWVNNLENRNIEDILSGMMIDSFRFDFSINSTEADYFLDRINTNLNRFEERQEDVAESLSGIQESLRRIGSLTL